MSDFVLEIEEGERPDLSTGMAGVHLPRATKDEWITPPEIIKALGHFDLDPCAPVNPPWPCAARRFSIEDNGLRQKWEGRVWMNPPYGRETGKFMGRLVEHGDGIALIFARTETDVWLQHIWGVADAILFLAYRITFYHVDGRLADYNAGAPSAFVAYGKRNVEALENSGFPGALVKDTRVLNYHG